MLILKKVSIPGILTENLVVVVQEKLALKIKKSSIIYSRIETELREKGLLNPSEYVMPPKSIDIREASEHAKDRLKKRNITMEDAQHYVDSAMVMIQQSKDKFNFIAEDGCSYVLESGRLVSVISKADYDSFMKQKVEVIESWLKKK